MDLGNWASEKYKIASPAAMDESEGEENPEDGGDAERTGQRPGQHERRRISEQGDSEQE